MSKSFKTISIYLFKATYGTLICSSYAKGMYIAEVKLHKAK
jgi:hypothetical protein